MPAVAHRQVGGDQAHVRGLFQGELPEMFVVQAETLPWPLREPGGEVLRLSLLFAQPGGQALRFLAPAAGGERMALRLRGPAQQRRGEQGPGQVADGRVAQFVEQFGQQRHTQRLAGLRHSRRFPVHARVCRCPRLSPIIRSIPPASFSQEPHGTLSQYRHHRPPRQHPGAGYHPPAEEIPDRSPPACDPRGHHRRSPARTRPADLLAEDHGRDLRPGGGGRRRWQHARRGPRAGPAQGAGAGINRGSLGFLTDIRPDELEAKVGEVLDGQYIVESRFLLDAQVRRGIDSMGQGDALNDVVLRASRPG